MSEPPLQVLSSLLDQEAEAILFGASREVDSAFGPGQGMGDTVSRSAKTDGI